MNVSDWKIGVVGLGYVGLPLAVSFGKKRPVIGYDINENRIKELAEGVDATKEIERDELKQAKNLKFSTDSRELKKATCFIVTVPTPIDSAYRPDLRPLIDATRTVGSVLKKGDVVIYESTVYPGCTEEECVPILEEESGLRFNVDFYCGYSPERINPGDKENRLENICKITSGSTMEIADKIDQLYQEIISAGTYKASSMQVAEAAKVIENTQRDVNIALINELAIIMSHLGIDTEEVLEAAGSKWNFLPFRPGLVGGHCIGIDPYYLKFRAQSAGYHPEIISSVRKLNDGMGQHVVEQLIKQMIVRKITFDAANILIMGFSFKENCPDLRNTRVIDIVDGLKEYGMKVDVYDPWVSRSEAKHDYGVEIIEYPEERKYDSVILAVSHDQFKTLGPERIRGLCKDNSIIYDLKYVLSIEDSDLRL